jgi:hypothetical protein
MTVAGACTVPCVASQENAHEGTDAQWDAHVEHTAGLLDELVIGREGAKRAQDSPAPDLQPPAKRARREGRPQTEEAEAAHIMLNLSCDHHAVEADRVRVQGKAQSFTHAFR